MKRVVLLVLLFGLMFVSAVEPSAGIDGDDMAAIEGVVEQLPFDESGKGDFGKYDPFVTKAELRITEINLWLEDNASWLKVVFGMVPSLTWLFVANLYVWLFFVVVFILNADATFSWLPFLNRKSMDWVFFEMSWARLFGIVLFSIIIGLKSTVSFATLIVGLADILWNYVLPWGIAIAIIALVIFGVGVGAAIPIFLRIVTAIKYTLDERRKRKADTQESLNREVLEKVVEGVTGD